jgi:hypothetical protein
MPGFCAWDRDVRVCEIPSGHPDPHPGLAGVVRERSWLYGEPGIGKIALLSELTLGGGNRG